MVIIQVSIKIDTQQSLLTVIYAFLLYSKIINNKNSYALYFIHGVTHMIVYFLATYASDTELHAQYTIKNK